MDVRKVKSFSKHNTFVVIIYIYQQYGWFRKEVRCGQNVVFAYNLSNVEPQGTDNFIF